MLQKRVLKDEIKGIEDLITTSIDDSFIAMVDKIEHIQKEGRVIVSGMGKSGHIANKIVATLSSTGTPSLFVHPAEASHGDLGIITQKDIVIALSNSGETSELSDIINYCARFNIYLISFSRNPNSTLAKQANLSINIPQSQEACTLRLAPTTSTTQMLVLGDALAICLLEKKGFSSEDFYKFHPGGKLGQQLTTVSKVMHTGKKLPLINHEEGLFNALDIMSKKIIWLCRYCKK